jgi:hypothetical protein
MANNHSKHIPAEVLEQVRGKLKESLELLSQYTIALTPMERRGMLKMGEKTLSFVDKAHEAALANDNLRPPFLNMEEYDIDYSDARALWGIRSLALQLYESIDDTEMAAGGEAYQASLVFYNSVKMAAAQDISGAKAIYNELRQRFPHGKRKTSEGEAEMPSDSAKKNNGDE